MKQGIFVVSAMLGFLMLLSVSGGCAGRSAVHDEAAGPYGHTRIVVLPFYTEEGVDADRGGGASRHYRRIMRFINNHLVRHGFEVINPFAREKAEREYNRIMARAREDSPLAAMEMCRKYGTDAAYMVWLHVRVSRGAGGLCTASARVDGEGYDSAGRDLGAGVSKGFAMTENHCADAIAEAEKEAGDVVGRTLTAWRDRRYGAVAEPGGRGHGHHGETDEGGFLERRSRSLEDLVNVRLDGATEYEAAEVFGKVLSTAPGVVEAKRYGSRIVPDNPQASYSTWRVRIEDTEPFRLQANVMKAVNDVLDAGGEVWIRGVPYRYTAGEVNLLMGIRPGDATSREVQFVLDRERLRDREFEGRHDPYRAPQQKSGHSSGFE